MRLTERGQSLLAFLVWTLCGAVAGLAAALVFIAVTPSNAPQEVIPTSHSSQQGR